MQIQFLSTHITANNAKGRTFSAKLFDLEELGWDFENTGLTDEEVVAAHDEHVIIEVTEEGETFFTLFNVKMETGDDAQTIKDLDTLRLAHQLKEEA